MLDQSFLDITNIVNSIILRFDTKGNVTFFNEFAQFFFGFAEKEILGKNIVGTIVPQTDYAGHDLKAMIDDLLINPQKYINNENENITRDGRHVWVSWTNKPILGEDGQIKEVLSVGNDISLLKRTEVELESAKELAESAGHIGTVICSADMTIRAINSTARKYFQLEECPAPNLDFCSVALKYYTSPLSAEQICDFSTSHLSFDLVRPESETSKALYLQVQREVLQVEKRVTSVIFSIQDVTDQRKEEMLKQDFLSLISHKLRTPMTIILQIALLIKDDKKQILSEQQKALLNRLTDEAFKLNGLIANLLNFVSISSQNLTNDQEVLLLAEYLPTLTKPLVKVKGKRVDLAIDCPDKNLSIKMNRICFDHMISNLLDNAIKFNNQEKIEVKITAKQVNHHLVLMVADNGPGIAIEDQEKIFGAFYQPEKYFTGNVEGAGLGLPLVKKIVTAYGGTVSLKSALGDGATFTLTFPALE